VISGGNLPDGTPIQFDKNSLDMMDRTFGLYLSELSAVYAPPAVAGRQGQTPASAYSTGRLHRSAAGGAGALVSAATFDSILNYIGVASSLTGLTQAYSDSLAKDPTFLDKLLTVRARRGRSTIWRRWAGVRRSRLWARPTERSSLAYPC
jgi:hypothetical protein